MKTAIYARYSSDNQRDASISDQLRLCRRFVEKEGWHVEEEYSDHAISGATLLRPGFQALMREALSHRFDVVLAESLDRFSRDQEDTAGLFKRLTFVGVRIITISEGEITHLHVGLKGTMNAIFLKDLADKTRRGLRGRVEAGRSGGGLCYGYRVVRSLSDGGNLATGEREILADKAGVVLGIFRDYASGQSPKAIAKRLNAEGVAGPGKNGWNPSTIHGNVVRGTGILNNELYVGRIVWNRLRYLKDPDTGKRVSRLNPPSEWVTTNVPELRIVDDELWSAVKARQAATRKLTCGDPEKFKRARRPKFIFSGLARCTECGGGYVMYWQKRLACFNARSRGTCTNRRTISRTELESRVLLAVRDKLMRRDLFAEFCQEYVKELNRLRMEHRAKVSQGRHELAVVEKEIRKLVQAIKDGVSAVSIKSELLELESRQAELQKKLTAPDMPELLHPAMADVYREKVTELVRALQEDEDRRIPAADAIRGLIEAILLEPDGEGLKITLKGNLAGMLTAAGGGKRSPETGDLLLQIQMVAGGGFEPPTFGL